LLFLTFIAQKSAILTNFCTPKISGLGRCQSQDLG